MKWLKKHLPKVQSIENEAVLLRKTDPIDGVAAKKKIMLRLTTLSESSGLRYNKVKIKNQKTRWGSCSDKKNINLNINLARVPEELMDYAIMHELVHTKIMNHSKTFWNMLGKYVNTPKQLDQELKKYQALLIR